MKKLALLLALLLVVPSIAYAQLTLTITVVGNGTVTLDPPGGVYAFGTDVILTANAIPCLSAFVEWSGDLTGSVNPDTITIEAATNITATFE